MNYLLPKMSTLQTEHVLVQAFKKTVNYIRDHNWFADVLELDLAVVDYPTFLSQLRHDIALPASWESQKARLVPAPKSAPWWINKQHKWEPRRSETGKAMTAKLRPLA